MSPRRGRVCVLLLVGCLTWFAFAPVRACAQVSAADRAAAAEAYDKGADAFLRHNYAESAHWFERANRFAPSSVALIQAVRANQKLGRELKTLNLALELRDRYPDNQDAQRFAIPILQQAHSKYLLAQVNCDAKCTVEVDGALSTHRAFYLDPGRSHEVVAEFSTGRRSETVAGKAGKRRELYFKAPPKPKVVDADAGRKKPLPRWAFFTAAAATVGLAGAFTWSAMDTRNSVDAYELAAQAARSPGIGEAVEEEARRLLKAGQKKERRTNILMGVTIGVGVGTAVLGGFTQFKTERRQARSVRPILGGSPKHGMLGLEGSF